MKRISHMPLHCLPLHTNHIEHGIGLRTCFFHSLQTFKAALRNEDNAKQQRSHWMARDPVPNQHRGVELIDAPRLWQVDIIRRSILPHSCLLNEIWEQREAPCVPISTHHVVHEDFGIHTMLIICTTPFDNIAEICLNGVGWRERSAWIIGELTPALRLWDHWLPSCSIKVGIDRRADLMWICSQSRTNHIDQRPFKELKW